jgi:hypothetical protein
MMKIATAIEIEVKTIVKLVAMLNAAPGFLRRVSWRKDPSILRGAPERFSTAQFLVRKSIAQIKKARAKRR